MKKPKIKPYRIDKLSIREKGYHKHFRGRFKLLKLKILTPAEYILWDYCFSVLADWDASHEGFLGTFDYSQAEIAEMLGFDNSTISKNLNSLIKKGYIKELPSGLYYVTLFTSIIERLKRKGKSDVITINSVLDELTNAVDGTIENNFDVFQENDLYQGPDLFSNTIDFEY